MAGASTQMSSFHRLKLWNWKNATRFRINLFRRPGGPGFPSVVNLPHHPVAAVPGSVRDGRVPLVAPVGRRCRPHVLHA